MQHNFIHTTLATSTRETYPLDERLENDLDRNQFTRRSQLRHKNTQLNIFSNSIQVPRAKSAKYIGLHLVSRMNWNHHV